MGYFTLLRNGEEEGWATPESQAPAAAKRINQVAPFRTIPVTLLVFMGALVVDFAVKVLWPSNVPALVLAALIEMAVWSGSFILATKTIKQRSEQLDNELKAGEAIMLSSPVYRTLACELYLTYMLDLRYLLTNHRECVPLMADYLKQCREATLRLRVTDNRAEKLGIHVVLVANAKEAATQMALAYRRSTALEPVTD